MGMGKLNYWWWTSLYLRASDIKENSSHFYQFSVIWPWTINIQKEIIINILKQGKERLIDHQKPTVPSCHLKGCPNRIVLVHCVTICMVPPKILKEWIQNLFLSFLLTLPWVTSINIKMNLRNDRVLFSQPTLGRISWLQFNLPRLIIVKVSLLPFTKLGIER